MRNCFGDRAYVRYMSKLRAAEEACSAKPYEPTAFQPKYQPYRPGYYHNGFQYFNREKVHDLSMKMRMSVANGTCVLLEMGYIDESYNIQTQYMIDEIKDVGRIDKELLLDLVNGIKDCSAFASCMPYDNMQYPMTAGTMRYLNFNVCRENANLFACMKKDVRSRRYEFEAIGPGASSDRLTDDDKIFSLLWAEATATKSFKKF
ncbi:uncharacterized protein LOC108673705 [Hyalella azteca]|uniref:Uncharacterized protein LOC108673705 n=1 Tax=Hyalella azteca TaxID=294128 RepID=A0A8B7NVV2_HYAAZ|nr:uncharacterized protein LOC108673705 [Hyalella azteca]